MSNPPNNSIQLFPEAFSGDPAYCASDAEPLFGRTLRIALAMRGGVSLAVWIGGAVGELDLLRRIRWTAGGACYFLWPVSEPATEADTTVIERAKVYARVLRSRGYDHLEYDVLAGASAGGLNSILYSVAQRVGARLDAVLGVWVEYGAFWKLMRGTGFEGIDSPLDGDGYFAQGVDTALHRLYASTTAIAEHEAHHVVVDISATVIDTEDSLDPTSRSGRGEFHFVGADHRAFANQDFELKEFGRGIPVAGAPDGDSALAVSLARLAYSARSTSSLPGGFEPSLIYSSRVKKNEEDTLHIDMSRAFHVHRDGFDKPFRIVDGGLTDNIPIDRAFKAIQKQASEVYADRAIIYLDPAPPSHPIIRTPQIYSGPAVSRTFDPSVPREKRTDPSSRLLTVVSRALGLRVNAENAADKAEAIDEYRRQLFISAGRRSSLAALTAAATGDEYVTSVALGQYARYRAAADAELIYDVLEDPDVWQLGTDLGARYSFSSLSGLQLAELEQTILARYEALLASPGFKQSQILVGPLAVVDCCRSLLTWVRALEDATFRGASITTRIVGIGGRSGQKIGDLRGVIYDALATANAAADIMLLDVCAAALTVIPPIEPKAPPTPAQTTPIARAVEQLVVARDPEMEDLLIKLDVVSRTLATLTKGKAKAFVSTIWVGFPTKPDVLAIEVAAFCAAAGIPDALTDIKYWEISAESDAAHDGAFTMLKDEDFRRKLISILSLKRARDVDRAEVGKLIDPGPLSVDAKLTGSALGAFAGFLSGDWRRNDWLWGRLDGASGILQFLDSIAVPRDGLEAPGEESASLEVNRRVVQDSILTEARESQLAGPVDVTAAGRDRSDKAPFAASPAPTAEGDELRKLVSIGADGIANLSPGYRMGVASKAAHLAFRAVGRWGTSPWAVFLTGVLKPLANLLPSVVDVPRAITLLAILAGTWTVGWVRTGQVLRAKEPLLGGNLAWWLIPVIAIAVLAVTISSGVKAAERWRRVDEQLELLPPSARRTAVIEKVDEKRSAAISEGMYLMCGAVVALFATIVLSLIRVIAVPSALLGLAAGIVLAIVASRRFGAAPATGGYVLRDRIVTGVGGALLFAVFLFPHGIARWIEAPDALPHVFVASLPILVGITALLVSLVCNWGWQAGIRPAPFYPQDSSPTKVAKATSLAMLKLRLSGPWWALQAVIAGAVAWGACWIMDAVAGHPNSAGIRFICAAVALFVAGTVQWYLTQFELYQPSDAAERPTAEG